jgi:chromosome segregation ATPase
VNCPKCGFVQEERADCRKCGVVFAKFFALRVQEAAPAPEVKDSQPAPQNNPEEHHMSDAAALLEVRQGLRNLQQRFHEMEFEKAERRRIRGEMRALDMRLQEGLGRITACQEESEQLAARLADLPPSASLQDFAALKMEVRAIDIISAHKRIERLESRILSLSEELAAKADLHYLELLPKMDERLEEVENRLEKLAETNGAALGNDATSQLAAALSAFEELKVGLQNVTLRYSEIGELKKNHLVLRDMVESLQHASESLKKAPANGNSAKITELDKEVSALKAEVRKAYERVELLESHLAETSLPPEAAPLCEVASLREEFANADKQRAGKQQQIQKELSALEAKFCATLSGVAKFPEDMATISARIHHMNQQYQQLAETLEQVSQAANTVPPKTIELTREVDFLREECLQTRAQIQALEEKLNNLVPIPSYETTTPAQSDMHAIRDNLNEIRHFMATLSRKL